MIRTYDVRFPQVGGVRQAVLTAPVVRTTASGLVVTRSPLDGGGERWTYDYSNCRY